MVKNDARALMKYIPSLWSKSTTPTVRWLALACRLRDVIRSL